VIIFISSNKNPKFLPNSTYRKKREVEGRKRKDLVGLTK
jgi:hypothetical protein